MELKPRELLNQENLQLTSGTFIVDGIETKNFGNGDVVGLNLTDVSDAGAKFWYGIGKIMSRRLSSYNLKPEDLVGKKVTLGIEEVKLKKYGKRQVIVIKDVE